MTERKYVKPEPQIVPAPYAFSCFGCGAEVEKDEPIAYVGIRPEIRGLIPVCQECGCTEEE